MVEPGSVRTHTRSESAEVPVPRAEQPGGTGVIAANHASAGLLAARRATTRLDELVAGLTGGALSAPSRLPGWTRGHVLTHLARNADGLVNLLTWAKTGIEHQMYPSTADRDADIDEGAHRLLTVQREDFVASNDRFFAMAESLPDSAWQVGMPTRQGWRVQASNIPWMRLTELLVHAVDLDLGMEFTDLVEVAGDQLSGMFDYLAWTYAMRSDAPSVLAEVRLPGDEVGHWSIGPVVSDPVVVRGSADTMLSWLYGRSDGGGLEGALPTLSAWM